MQNDNNGIKFHSVVFIYWFLSIYYYYNSISMDMRCARFSKLNLWWIGIAHWHHHDFVGLNRGLSTSVTSLYCHNLWIYIYEIHANTTQYTDCIQYTTHRIYAIILFWDFRHQIVHFICASNH